MQLSKCYQKIHQNAICIYSKKEVDQSLDKMAQEMNKCLNDSNPIFICILLGGIVPLGNLLPRLNFQLEINYIHITSYGSDNKIGKLQWKATPTINLLNRTVVLIDDILDTGYTMKGAIEYCKSKGASKVYTAVLLSKCKPRSATGLEQANFKAMTIEDIFVFGYGLDYSNYLRNLPGIYTLNPDKDNK